MKKKRIIIIILTLIVFVVLFYLIYNSKKDSYEFSGNTLYYSENRGKVNYDMNFLYSNLSYDVYKISFDSRKFLDEKTKIYGLLYLPKTISNRKIPGVVYMPGGGMAKEGAIIPSSEIAQLGYAVLTIDQRGIGETRGTYLGFEQDYQVFASGKEPMQHLAVYDALRGFDVLRGIKGVDKDNIAIAGESMGARYSLIACAIDKRIKGFIGISVSGFNVKINPLIPGNNYIVSIDPDHYIDKISPRPVFMFHSKNDSVVPLAMAQGTFLKAKEPKKLYVFEDKNCIHGYCNSMNKSLDSSLKDIFK